MRKLLLVVCCLLYSMAATGQSPARLMYVGTLDKKLLIIDEDKESVAGEIPLGGIPRTTALSFDKKKLYIVSTQMLLETVDLEAKKVISSFSLNDPRTKVRIQANAPTILEGGGGRYSGIAVDPKDRYLYMTLKNTVKELDEYRIDPPQFGQHPRPPRVRILAHLTAFMNEAIESREVRRSGQSSFVNHGRRFGRMTSDTAASNAPRRRAYSVRILRICGASRPWRMNSARIA